MLRKIGLTLALALVVGGCKNEDGKTSSSTCKLVVSPLKRGTTSNPDPTTLAPRDGKVTTAGLAIKVTGMVSDCSTSNLTIALALDGSATPTIVTVHGLTSETSAPDATAAAFHFDDVVIPPGADPKHVLQVWPIADSMPVTDSKVSVNVVYVPDASLGAITLAQTAPVRRFDGDAKVNLSVSANGTTLANACDSFNICNAGTGSDCATVIAGPFKAATQDAVTSEFSVTLDGLVLDDCQRTVEPVRLVAECKLADTTKMSSVIEVSADLSTPTFATNPLSWTAADGTTEVLSTLPLATNVLEATKTSISVATKCANNGQPVEFWVKTIDNGAAHEAKLLKDAVDVAGNVATARNVDLTNYRFLPGVRYELYAKIPGSNPEIKTDHAGFVADDVGCDATLRIAAGSNYVFSNRSFLDDHGRDIAFTVAGNTVTCVGGTAELLVDGISVDTKPVTQADANGFNFNLQLPKTALKVHGAAGVVEVRVTHPDRKQVPANPPRFNYKAYFDAPTITVAGVSINGTAVGASMDIFSAPVVIDVPVSLFDGLTGVVAFANVTGTAGRYDPMPSATIGADGHARLSVTLHEGEQTIYLRAMDSVGNWSVEVPLHLFVDYTGCAVVISDYPNDNTFNLIHPPSTGNSTTRVYTLNGASQNCPGIAPTVTKTLTGGTTELAVPTVATLNANGSFSLKITLNDNESGFLHFRVSVPHKNPNAGGFNAPFKTGFTSPTINSVTITAPSPNPAGSSVYDTQTLTVVVSVTGAEGRTVEIRSSLNPNTVIATGTVQAGTATIAVTGVPVGTQTLTASTTSSAGNPSVPASGSSNSTPQFTVNLVGCDVQLSPAASSLVFGLTNTTGTGTSNRSATIQGVTTTCRSNSPMAVVTKVVGATRTPFPAVAVDQTTGAFSVTISLNDNETGSLQVQVYSSVATANAGISPTFVADFVPPTISWVTLPDTLFASVNAVLSVQVTDANGRPMVGQVVTIYDGAGNVIGSGPVSATGQADVSVTFRAVGDQLNVVAKVKDAAGNEGTTATSDPNRSFIVDTAGCAVALTAPAATPSPFVFNLANTTGASHTFTVTGTTTTALCVPTSGGRFTTTATVYINNTAVGTPVTVANNTGTFSATVPIPAATPTSPGTLKVVVTRSRALAPNAGASISFIAGFTAPVITWTTPAPATPYALLTALNAPLALSVSGSAANQTLTVTSNAPGAPNPTGTASVTAGGTASIASSNLIRGLQNLTANVTDIYGNPAAAASIPVMVDTDGCVVQITDPTPSPFMFNTVNTPGTGTTRNYTVKGKTTTAACIPATGISSLATFKIGGSQVGTGVVQSDGTFSASIPISQTSTSTNLVVTVDRTPALATNSGATLAYTADFTPPVITWTTPAQPVSPATYALVTSLTPSVTLNVSGANSRTMSITSSLPAAGSSIGTPTINTSGVATFTTSSLTAGLQTWTATVTSASGNPATATIQVLVDTAGCVVQITDPTPSPFVFNTVNTPGTGTTRNYTVKGKTTTTACIPATGISSLATFKINGSQVGTGTVQADGTFSASIPIAQTSTSTNLVVTVDRTPALATNSGATLAYTADFTPPVITWTTPAQPVLPSTYALVTSLTPSVTLNVTGANNRAMSITSSVPAAGSVIASPTINGSGVATFTTSTLTAGLQTWTATVTSASGNPATATIPVMVDTAGCVVQLVDPATPTFTFNTVNTPGSGTTRTYTVKAKTTTAACLPVTGISSQATYKIGGSTVGTATVLADGTFSASISIAEATSANLVITVDRTPALATNAGTTLTYKADFTPPVISWTNPSAATPVVLSQNAALNLSISGGDSTGNTLTVTSNASGAPSPTATGPVAANGTVATGNTNLLVGRQTLTATVQDLAGNAAVPVSLVVDVDDGLGCDAQVASSWPSGGHFNLANTSNGTITVSGRTNKASCYTNSANGVNSVATFRVGSTVLGTTAVDSSGNFSGMITLPQGAGLILTVSVDRTPAFNVNLGTALGFDADFVAPKLESLVPSSTNIHIVYAGHPNAGQPGYVVDADSGTTGGQFDWTVNFSGAGNIVGWGQGSVTVTAAGNSAVSGTYQSNGALSLSGRFSFPDGTTNTTFEVTLVDSATNQTHATAWTVVEVATVPPPTITMTSPAAGTVNVFRDLGGNRSTYANVQGNITFSGFVRPNSEIHICTTVQAGSAGPCKLGGYYIMAGSQFTATGSQQFYPTLTLPEGAQTLVGELVDTVNDTFVNSTPVVLKVATVPPTVSAVAAPADASPRDGVITNAELAPDQAIVLNASFTGSINGQTASLYDGTTKLQDQVVANSQATFSLTGVTDGNHTFRVVVVDVDGNPNESSAVTPAITNPAATVGLNVRRVLPSISVYAPTWTACNAALDKDGGLTPNCDLDFVVAVGSEVTRVDFGGLGSPSPASVTSFTNGRATSSYSLGQGGPFTLTATAYDAYGNAQSKSTIITVDTVPPTISFTSPASGSVFTSQTIPVSLTTTGAVGQTVYVYSSVNGAEVGNGVVDSSGNASFNIAVPYSSAAQTLSARVSDAAGNSSSWTTTSLTLNLSGCDVNFTAPAGATITLNAANAAGGWYTITGNTTRPGCAGQTVSFTSTVNGVTTAIGTTTASLLDGSFSLVHRFDDGTKADITASITYGGTTQTRTFTASTDITPPLLTINGPTTDGSNHLYIVASTGNINIRDHVAGYLADADSAAGGQVDFNVTCTGCGDAIDGLNGSLTFKQGLAYISNTTIANNGTINLSPLRVTFDHGFSGTVTVTASDAAGNTASYSWSVTVDVIAPPSPTFVLVDAGDGKYTHISDHRRADLVFAFTTPADDGPAVNPLTWEYGYATSTKLGTAALDSSNFDNSAIVTKPVPPAVGATGSTVAAILSSVPPLNIYSFAPRLIDGVGNRSDLVVTTLDVSWSRNTIAYPWTSSTTAQFGAIVATGDINGDGVDDIAVSALTENNTTGSVTVYYATSATALRAQQFVGPTAGAYYGYGMTLIDLDQNGHADLVTRDSSGKTDVYLAPSNGGDLPATPSFTFTGGSVFNIAAVPDLNGDGYPDLVLTNNTATSYSGKAYVWYSRPSWAGLISAGTVNITQANAVITTPTANTRFGTSITGVAGANGGVLFGAAGSAYFFKSTTIQALGPTMTTAQADWTASPGGGFGTAVAVADVDGQNGPDLVISDASDNKVYTALRTAGGTYASPTVFFSGVADKVGSSLTVADLNGDGYSDLIVGANGDQITAMRVFWGNASGISSTPGSVVSGEASFSNSVAVGNIGATSLVVSEFAYQNGRINIIY